VRCTTTDLSVLSYPRGQKGEFSNLRNIPVKFFVVTAVNDECGNQLLSFSSLLVAGYTNKLNILTVVCSAHTVFMCFVFV
jgi:hypothetical protein